MIPGQSRGSVSSEKEIGVPWETTANEIQLFRGISREGTGREHRGKWRKFRQRSAMRLSRKFHAFPK